MLARQDCDNFGQCVSAVLLLASCSGQYNALEENNATDPQSTLPQASDTAQVAEYVVEAFENARATCGSGPSTRVWLDMMGRHSPI